MKIPFSHLFSSEIDKHAVISIKANYSPKIIFEDMLSRDLKKVPYVDIYVCGFPCQTFSNVGNRAGFNDKKGTIFFSCIKLIKNKQPMVFILENVKGLLHHNNGNTYQIIQDKLSKLKNYNIYYQILNTKDYGIPQNRERIFIIGIRKDAEINQFQFPNKNTNKLKKLQSYVDKKDNSSKDPPPRITKSNYLSTLPKNSVFVDFSLYGRSSFPNSDKICSCIARKSEFWCVQKNRPANYKELLSLQGFPKNFKKVVSNTQMKMQIGNSMSVNVLKEIFKEIFRSMNINL